MDYILYNIYIVKRIQVYEEKDKLISQQLGH